MKPLLSALKGLLIYQELLETLIRAESGRREITVISRERLEKIDEHCKDIKSILKKLVR